MVQPCKPLLTGPAKSWQLFGGSVANTAFFPKKSSSLRIRCPLAVKKLKFAHHVLRPLKGVRRNASFQRGTFGAASYGPCVSNSQKDTILWMDEIPQLWGKMFAGILSRGVKNHSRFLNGGPKWISSIRPPGSRVCHGPQHRQANFVERHEHHFKGNDRLTPLPSPTNAE